MTLRLLKPLLAAAALSALTVAAAHAAAPAAKPAAKPAAAKPAAPAGAAPAKIPNFDARDPQSLSLLLQQVNAQAKVGKPVNGQVPMEISTPGGAFGAQLIGCDANGKACHAVAFFTAFEKKGATLAQINDFNRAQLACRGILTPDGRPSVMYPVMLNQRMTSDEMRLHLGVWQGCLTAFGEFARDPDAFLSKPHS